MKTKDIEIGALYVNKFGETIRITGKKKAGWFNYERKLASGFISTPWMQVHARAIIEKLSPKEG